MRPPIHRLNKKEIVWLASHNCEAHRKAYLEHYTCYVKELPQQDRTAVYDIETSNLDADYGIVLTWCILPLDGVDIQEGIISKTDIKKGRHGDEDHRVVADLVQAMRKYDRLIGYYSKRFDMPYIRARAVNMDIDFPHFGTIQHVDVYDIIKTKFKLSRRSQENACRNLLRGTNKTHFDGSIWRDAARGNKQALAQVLDHNRKDVIDLKALYLRVRDYSRKHDVSL